MKFKSELHKAVVMLCALFCLVTFVAGFFNPIHFLYAIGCGLLTWAFYKDKLFDVE